MRKHRRWEKHSLQASAGLEFVRTQHTTGAESAGGAEFAVNAAQVLNGIRASFWAVAKELSDEDFSNAAAPLLEAANRIVEFEWDDDEEEQE